MIKEDINHPAGSAIKQLSAFIPNRVGALMSLTKLLKDYSITILGMSLQDSTEMTLVRLVLTDPDSAAILFIEKGIPHTQSEIVVVELDLESHSMVQCMSELLEAKINIDFCYSLLVQPHGQPLLAMHTPNADLAASALTCSGFKVLMQEDLSR
jgi:hypothetical protein